MHTCAYVTRIEFSRDAMGPGRGKNNTWQTSTLKSELAHTSGGFL